MLDPLVTPKSPILGFSWGIETPLLKYYHHRNSTENVCNFTDSSLPNRQKTDPKTVTNVSLGGDKW